MGTTARFLFPPACPKESSPANEDPAKLPEARRILSLFTDSRVGSREPGWGGGSCAQSRDKGKLSVCENRSPPRSRAHCMSPSSKGLCINLKNQTDLSVGVTYITRLQVPLFPPYAGAGSACLLLL